MKKIRSSPTASNPSAPVSPQSRTARPVPPVAAGQTPARAAKPRAAKAGTTRAAGPSPDAIAARAYELFAARDWTHGHDLDDWLQAEAELSAKPARARRRAAGE
jgi:hypothetical protein